MRLLTIFRLFLLLSPLLWLSCEIDHGLGTMDSRISGKIILLNPDQKPDYVESVRIVGVVNFPPESLGDVVFTNRSVNLSKAEPDYYIPAPLGTYHLIVAVYKVKGKEWDYLKWLGYYGFDPVTWESKETTITLSKNHPVATGIDIVCDWSLLPDEE